MIRFSALLVVVGLGLLIAGGVTSKLLLIYIAIGVSAVALLFLIIGAIVNRAELFGREPDGIATGETERDGYAGELDEAPEPATTAVSAGASANRGYAREHTESPGYGAASTPPDRSRGAVFDDPLSFSDGRGKNRDVTGHDPFPGDEDRRPSEPQRRTGRPFTDPTPTRMDLSAAAVREAGRQEQERSGRDRSERNQPGGNRPERAQPGRQPADQPFIDPSPTRLDWAGGLREAEQQERARQEQEQRDRDRPERDRAGWGQLDQPFTDPSPTRLDWAADLRQGDTHGGATAPVRRPGERETTHTSQPAPTQPAPTQPAAARPDKLLVSRPDTSDALSPGSKPGPDQPAGHDGGNTMLPGEQVTSSPAATGPDASSPADTPATSAAAATDSTERPVEVSATREQKVQAPAAAADPPESLATTGDSKDGSGPAGSAGPDQDVTVVPGVPRYHRTDCILIRFMGEGDLQRMTVERAQEAGCTPCRACQPDEDEEDD